MVLIRDIATYMAQWAPLAYQESYDNAGLQLGNPEAGVSRILTTLDCTEAVVAEAAEKGCQLIVAHHPLIFKGLKKLTGSHHVERTVLAAIKADVGLYASHTNLDKVQTGVNRRLADQLGLHSSRILAPERSQLLKLTVFVPQADEPALLQALGNAGAGHIGHYSHCSFSTQGTGRFTPTEGANPTLGQVGDAESVQESRVEVILPAPLRSQVLSAMQRAHPYEEVAYYMQPLQNENQDVGLGRIGKLSEPMDAPSFLNYVKQQLGAKVVQHSLHQGTIETVAVCGGSGVFLTDVARAAGADALVTADVKYHDWHEAEGLLLVDVGHYHSETATRHLLAENLGEAFPSLEVLASEVDTSGSRFA